MYTNSMYIQEARCPKSAQKCHTVWRELVRDWRTPVGILTVAEHSFCLFSLLVSHVKPCKVAQGVFQLLDCGHLMDEDEDKGCAFSALNFFCLQLKMKSIWKRSETTHF